MTNTLQDDLYLANLEYNLQIAVARGKADEVCTAYLIENRSRLMPQFLRVAVAQKRDIDAVVADFARGVHKRHLDGLPLK